MFLCSHIKNELLLIIILHLIDLFEIFEVILGNDTLIIVLLPTYSISLIFADIASSVEYCLGIMNFTS